MKKGIIISLMALFYVYTIGADLPEDKLQVALFGPAPVPRSFQGEDLRGVNWTGVYVWRAIFNNADLRGANLTGVKAWGAKFYNADLRGVNLTGALLWEVNFNNADLRGANLTGARLWRARFEGAKYNDKTIFPEGWTLPDSMIKVE